MLYYGKLRKHREFLHSSGLSKSDRAFFDLWFNRCRNTNSLLPFLEKRVNNKVWAFFILSGQSCYIGITSNSQDLSERKFPFICFDLLAADNAKNNIEASKAKLAYYISRHKKFSNLIDDGILNQYFLDTIQTQTSENFDTATEINNFFNNMIETNEGDISCWIDIKSGYTINYNNSLTCSLYNKIYG